MIILILPKPSNMIKQILSGFIAIFLFANCTKTQSLDENGDYYMKFKLNGAQKEYRWAVGAVITENLNGTIISGVTLSGALNPSLDEVIAIAVTDVTSSTIKINHGYTTSFDIDNGLKVALGINFDDGSGVEVSETDPLLIVPNQVIITELTDTYVKGRFKGELVEDENGNNLPQKRMITDGEFFAQRVENTANLPGSPGTGTGYLEFILENKNYRIDERLSNGNVVTVKMVENNGFHSLHFTASSATSLPANIFTMILPDTKPITYTGEYKLTEADNRFLLFQTQFMSVSSSVNNSFSFTHTADSQVTINITRNDKTKGGKIEGTFSITNMEKLSGTMTSLGKNLPLTGGKFSATIN
jgi:hypothetical protein